MSPAKISPLVNIKGLTFDVFGTTVDWRSSVIEELELRIHRKRTGAGAEALPAALRERLQYLDEQDSSLPPGADTWIGRFADTWRAAYLVFVKSQASAGVLDAGRPFHSTDAHHHESLVALLDEFQLEGLFSDAELTSLSLVWHRLRPWADSVAGLAALAAPPLGLVVATLTNGNEALIRDLDGFGELGFQHLFCAETFRAYKPAPEAYRGAAARLGLPPGEVAMVATHMLDLAAARSVGFRTVYVERPREEAWGQDDERFVQAREWVDLWIKEDEDGFVEMAKRLEELRS